MSPRASALLVILLCATLVACVGPQPNEDYLYAWAALKAARSAQAPKYASGFWNKAQYHYDQALADYAERDYDQARVHFKLAKEFAEKSENYTVLKKAETGAVD